MDAITQWLPAIIIGFAALALIIFVITVITKNIIKVPSDVAGVFIGQGETKIVVGGSKIRIPGLVEYYEMSLTPHDVSVDVRNVFSKDGTPINVTGSGVVSYGRSQEELKTSTGQYLRTPRNVLDVQVKNILEGVVRSVVASMTVEELNNERLKVADSILSAGTDAYKPNGMGIGTFVIQNIADDNGYLESLGAPKNAEVKKNAEVARAEAERDTVIRKADAQQKSMVAQAESEVQIAKARQARDLELAAIKAEVDAENARSAQRGPQAQAEAEAAVEVAKANAKRQAEEAQIAYEQQRALRVTQTQRADVIIPAEAERESAVIKAEGARQAAVLKANGDRDATIAAANADAQSRTLKSVADADARKALAEALFAEMKAQADGEAAKLLAQAEGQEKLAEAFNKLSDQAGRLQVLPKLIETLPAVVRAIADGVKIDHMVVMDNGGSGGNGSALQRAASTVPTTLFQANETLKALGVDIMGLLGGFGGNSEPLKLEESFTDPSSDSQA